MRNVACISQASTHCASTAQSSCAVPAERWQEALSFLFLRIASLSLSILLSLTPFESALTRFCRREIGRRIA